MARPLFVGGTASNAGKSWMATAMCAWLRKRGARVAPFKAQNMSNHSYPCRSGGEIGRAQVAQAEACGLEPEPAMNPILLKPNGDGTSQVIVHGRVWKTLSAREYYAQAESLVHEVLRAYADLAQRFDVIVIEGAGSVSELNLRDVDLVNLGLVQRLGAPWTLVADIERGGVFASVVGTVALLSPAERALLRGFLVNKFRGDSSLFDPGRRMLEEKTGVPCLGVFPYAEDLHLDAEDSLALERARRRPAPPGASIAIVRFPRLSNGTDFRLLDWAEWIDEPPSRTYDFVILPGTKDTLADLQWMRQRALDRWVLAQKRRGATIVGICGGFQMMGDIVRDPLGVESSGGTSNGLGLVAAETTLTPDKVVRVRRATSRGGRPFLAYEIHLGVTTLGSPQPVFARLDDGTGEGVWTEGVIGTYLHGAFEDGGLCEEVFGTPIAPTPGKTATYDALAQWFERHAERPAEWLLSSG